MTRVTTTVTSATPRIGLQQLRIISPTFKDHKKFNSDLSICPLALEGCSSAKEPGFYGRCTGSYGRSYGNDYPYLYCERWNGESEQPLSEDNPRTRRTGASPLVVESVDDAIADGVVDPLRLAGIGRSVLQSSRGYDASVNRSCWPDWSWKRMMEIREAFR